MNTQTLTHTSCACACLLLIVSCGNPRPQFQAEDGLLSKSTVAQLVASDKSWGTTEGPAVDSKGTLYFCSRGSFKGIESWNSADGARQYLAIATKEGPGGLWVDDSDNIWLTATGERQIQRITPDKKMSIVAQSFESDPKTAKGPNDLVVTKNGTCYFTDPNGYYGESAPGTVYYVTPDGKTSVLSRTVVGPNGIALGGDEKTLLVAGNVAKSVSKVVRWPLKEDGSAGEMADVATVNNCVADGIAVDREGSVWLTCYSFGTAYRLSPDGKVQEKVTTEQKGLTNVKFGRAGLNDALFLTSTDLERATGYIYRAQVTVPGNRK